MEEIKVGEYIRTIDGYIRKIDNINEDRKEITYKGKYILDIPYKNSQSVNVNKIINHSFNIIDLIEVGDYVNGIEVMNIYKPNDLWEPIEIEVDSKYVKYFLVDEIKSIVTKEQFKNIEYKVGGIKC